MQDMIINCNMFAVILMHIVSPVLIIKLQISIDMNSTHAPGITNLIIGGWGVIGQYQNV